MRHQYLVLNHDPVCRKPNPSDLNQDVITQLPLYLVDCFQYFTKFSIRPLVNGFDRGLNLPSMCLMK